MEIRARKKRSVKLNKMAPKNFPQMIKYCDISRLGHEENENIFDYPDDVVVITEKIGGGNGQFRLHDGEIIFGSRNNQFRVGDGSAQNKQFGENAGWILGKLFGNGVGAEKTAGDLLNPDYVYYGEWCKKHTINYAWDTMPKFVGFDIRDIRTGVFIPYQGMKDEYDRLGLPVVPLITRCKVSELDLTRLENFISKSAYYDGLMEGIVIKNYFRKNIYERQLFAKIVREEFKEANAAAFNNKGGWIKPLNDDTTKFIDTFYTEARIRKAMLRLTEESGHKLDMPLMHHLPKALIEDIMKEECWTLVKEFDSINFDRIRKVAPKKCLQVLKDVLKERVIQP